MKDANESGIVSPVGETSTAVAPEQRRTPIWYWWVLAAIYLIGSKVASLPFVFAHPGLVLHVGILTGAGLMGLRRLVKLVTGSSVNSNRDASRLPVFFFSSHHSGTALAPDRPSSGP